MADYVMTIDSDTEDPPSLKISKETLDDALNPDFVFDAGADYEDIFDGANIVNDLVKAGSKAAPISVDEIIARRRLSLKRKRAANAESDESESESEGDDDEEEGHEEESDDDPLASSEEEDSEGDEDENEETADEDDLSEGGSSSSEEEEEETEADRSRKAAFFAEEDGGSTTCDTFLQMNLSRPILKAISSLGFTKPTPIQASTIPVALLGKDIVGNAVTGSGKTAAFMIPMLERLLYREKGKRAAATRCLILLPTRELAVQCYEVGKRLGAHTDIQFCLLVGGLSLKAQEAALRQRPDVVLATPGRLIDHVRNSVGFNLDSLDILVLDEADRMLSEGFADELTEIIKACPKSRQTMLFSATMTDSVDELIKMSLNKPVRLFVDPKRSTARGLIQEFVRIRKESDRPAMLVALCKQTYKHKVIIFVRSKKLAHQMRIVFSLLGMKCAELHGDLSQEQRLQALQSFREGSVDYLMATDLASRGLDIKGVETVVNYDMPGQMAQYLHRVGRTARAGRKGKSVTLVGEADRKLLKAAIKHAAGEDQVRQRVLDTTVVQKYADKLEGLKGEIAEVMREEKEEKQLRQAEMELTKGENMMKHQDEIFSRPARTWFQTNKEKEKAKEISKQLHEGKSAAKGKQSKADESKPSRDKYSGLSRKAKRRKMAMEEDKESGVQKSVNAAIRSAKKASRLSKISMLPSKGSSSNANSSAKPRSSSKAKSNFDTDRGSRSKNQSSPSKPKSASGGKGRKPKGHKKK
ncbi:ATP-dependent RNA helicase drs1 [Coprinopsis cinerea okayama7|uniref:RNA helicase n=1 Tax=Coprinopsis cinerea (strain Okayama-7 / 130 / ATCC MYA-4618 / FGSC 9003) TaxID=240176 RepID=A8N1P2_COPC7|nr:ATP-dependent RNA helicase drs1 [Coprinopsis cinerea okayama7\|eukprot:XP_001828736.1 ATP-dependent RNA helicase drs1 [Coprinopsis cinerea okayama7\